MTDAPPGWEKYTPRARRVLMLADEERKRLGHSFIGTEHIQLGIVREGEGIAAGVLESLGLHKKIVTAIEFIIGRGNATE